MSSSPPSWPVTCPSIPRTCMWHLSHKENNTAVLVRVTNSTVVINSDFPQHLFISHSHLTPVRLTNDSGKGGVQGPRFFQSSSCLITRALGTLATFSTSGQQVTEGRISRAMQKALGAGYLPQANSIPWPHLTARGREMFSFVPRRAWQAHANASARISFQYLRKMWWSLK